MNFNLYIVYTFMVHVQNFFQTENQIGRYMLEARLSHSGWLQVDVLFQSMVGGCKES